MDKISLEAKARELTHKAAEASSGRAADTIFGGHEKRMRQTMIALREGVGLSEHESPGEATLLVVSGRLRLMSGDTTWHGREWDYLVVPNAAHSVEADTDAVFVLTVAIGR